MIAHEAAPAEKYRNYRANGVVPLRQIKEARGNQMATAVDDAVHPGPARRRGILCLLIATGLGAAYMIISVTILIIGKILGVQ